MRVSALDVSIVSRGLRVVVGVVLTSAAVSLAACSSNDAAVDCAFASADHDGDGLSNDEELAGYLIRIDETGFGLDDASLLTELQVTSDPCVADTDGDGASDADEKLARSNPRKPDSDGDGLSDRDELVRWQTSPISVDTDGDARGAGGAPDSALFDGAELALVDDPARGMKVPGVGATSPRLADTDGDGVPDGVERGNPTRSPVVADLPQLQIAQVDPVDMRLRVTYTDDLQTSREYSTSLSNSRASTLGKSDTFSLSASAGISVTAGASVEASAPPSVSASVEATVSIGIEAGYALQLDQSETREVSAEQSMLESESRGRSVSTEGGVLTVGLEARNSGNIAYRLQGLGVTVRQWLPSTGRYRSLGVMTLPDAVSNGFVLAASEKTPVIPFSLEVEPELLREFLRNPTSLVFEPVGVELQNADGTSFTFLTEATFAQTALVVVDKGDGRPRRMRVAVNVDRAADGSLMGVKLAHALQAAGIVFRTARDTTGREVVVELDGTRTESHTAAAPTLVDPPYPAGKAPGPRTARGFWAVLAGVRPSGAPIALEGDFSDVVLRDRDEVFVAFVRDLDQDGVYDREEFAWGADDSEVESDVTVATPAGDGLSDYFEMRVGWDVAVTGPMPRTYRVFPNPTLVDSDGDGLTDGEELALRTDPQLRDTDLDGQPDGEDASPTVFNALPVIRLRPSSVATVGRLDGTVVDPENAMASVTIAWGDGTDTVITSGFGAIGVNHLYMTVGNYQIRVTARDTGGQVAVEDYPLAIAP